MSSVLANSHLEAAIAVSDWLLSCLEVRKPQVYTDLFNRFLVVLQERPIGKEVFSLFLTLFDEIIDILKDAKLNDGIKTTRKILNGEESDSVQVHKGFMEVLREAEDFLTFLFIFAKHLDEVESKKLADEGCLDTDCSSHLCEILLVCSGNVADGSAGEGKENGVAEEEREKRALIFPDLRLKLMMAGYNALPSNSKFRYAAFMAIAEYAVKAKLFSTLEPYMNCVPDWMETWSVQPEQKRRLFSLLSSRLKEIGRPQKAFEFLIRLLATYDGCNLVEGSEESRQVLPHAVELVEDAIRRPDLMYFDRVVALEAVQLLQHVRGYARLFELLSCFYTGGPRELAALKVDAPEVFEQHNVDFDAAMVKVRLLALTSLINAQVAAATTLGCTELSLETVSRELELSRDDAEELVVLASNKGLIDGKIDQVNKKVLVKSAMQREFGRLQWEVLKRKIDSWEEMTSTMLEL